MELTVADFVDSEWIRESLMKTMRYRERQIALAVLRGDKLYTEKQWWGGSIEYDLTTRWWQFLTRRKLLRLARAELEKEDV